MQMPSGLTPAFWLPLQPAPSASSMSDVAVNMALDLASGHLPAPPVCLVHLPGGMTFTSSGFRPHVMMQIHAFRDGNLHLLDHAVHINVAGPTQSPVSQTHLRQRQSPPDTTGIACQKRCDMETYVQILPHFFFSAVSVLPSSVFASVFICRLDVAGITTTPKQPTAIANVNIIPNTRFSCFISSSLLNL